MPGRRWYSWLVPAVCALSLLGCNPFSDAESLTDEYLERLARVLDTAPVPRAELPAASIPPRRRERILALPELDLGMLDFLSLYGCELQYVVGERNSVMGKVMQPINQLRYEIRFIRAAEACLPQVDDEELTEALESAIESKRDSLPLAVWNATWGTEEVERQFTLSKGYYPVAEAGNPASDLVRDLQQLNRQVEAILADKLELSLENLGQVHQRWQADVLAGQTINSARLLISTLNAGTELLGTRLEGRPLCLNGQPNNQSEIVQNFFLSIYIGKIQPYMSDVSRARDSLIAGFAELARQQQAVMPESFTPWYQRHLAADTKNSLWQELDQAMMRHTRHWQDLLGQCGLRPGA
ncbi:MULTISPECIES: DUF3080 domain-containing protein [Marinobacter]|jgi:hypothetical protein|uniref:DUF3080 domain-containing protein n=1 Tax=Marinobacter TaxID=2742 RepID=UPI000C56817E|nr:MULTISPECIES: DUF3080 domain-containing protein [unclassified Marinobacter]MEC9387150.1 DUF3080 domain-containing protein [Pseudomonadota bacterium]HAX10028.1 DUF3080 domain-containing protein [Marinobacter nauticus]MAC23522.1 hypothetical protein [Marinobacter sp.]MAH30600.1 hypothetical protein [Marinobacter sp.]MAP31515.1 hypothetical protein [Marinobacter sp.]|tara:strand:+ start:2059 stop:3120 length:1062 start_codon:yes stop_codon:yes gene_type:complete